MLRLHYIEQTFILMPKPDSSLWRTKKYMMPTFQQQEQACIMAMFPLLRTMPQGHTACAKLQMVVESKLLIRTIAPTTTMPLMLPTIQQISLQIQLGFKLILELKRPINIIPRNTEEIHTTIREALSNHTLAIQAIT